MNEIEAKLEQNRKDQEKLREEEKRLQKVLEKRETVPTKIGDFGKHKEWLREHRLFVSKENVAESPNLVHCAGPDDRYMIFGNIFDVLEDGPIVIGLTEEEAKYLDRTYSFGNTPGVAIKIHSALERYQNARKDK